MKRGKVKYPNEEQVRARAYQIYVERGRQPGHEIDDWLQAEYELLQLPVSNIVELAAADLANPNSRRGRAAAVVGVARTALILAVLSGFQA